MNGPSTSCSLNLSKDSFVSRERTSCSFSIKSSDTTIGECSYTNLLSSIIALTANSSQSLVSFPVSEQRSIQLSKLYFSVPCRYSSLCIRWVLCFANKALIADLLSSDISPPILVAQPQHMAYSYTISLLLSILFCLKTFSMPYLLNLDSGSVQKVHISKGLSVS